MAAAVRAGVIAPAIATAASPSLALVHINHLLDRKPKVIPFDEPLSNLDAALRVKMRPEFARPHDELKTTMVCLTHEQVGGPCFRLISPILARLTSAPQSWWTAMSSTHFRWGIPWKKALAQALSFFYYSSHMLQQGEMMRQLGA